MARRAALPPDRDAAGGQENPSLTFFGLRETPASPETGGGTPGAQAHSVGGVGEAE